MTKKELLENEAFKALPDDSQIIFKTSEHRQMCVPLIQQHCWYEKRCTNLDVIQNTPPEISERIKPKYECYFIIDAMPFDYMKNKLNMTFEL